MAIMTGALLMFLTTFDHAEPQCQVSSLTLVQGQPVYCCTMASGQQCCAGSLGQTGRPAGCAC